LLFPRSVPAQFGNDCQKFKLALLDESPGAFATVTLARDGC